MSATSFDPREGMEYPPPPALPNGVFIQAADLDSMTYWVLEYSQSAKCLYIQTLWRSLEISLRRFMNHGKTGDWVIIGIFGTESECLGFSELMTEHIKSWDYNSPSGLTIDDLLRQISP